MFVRSSQEGSSSDTSIHRGIENYSLVPSVSLEEKGRTRDRELATSPSRAAHPLPIKAPWSSPSPPACHLWLYAHPSPMTHIYTRIDALSRRVLSCVYMFLVVTSMISLTSQWFSRASSFSWAVPTTLSVLNRPLWIQTGNIRHDFYRINHTISTFCTYIV